MTKQTLKGCDYISNNDYILNLINIKDPNIFILNNIKEKVIKNRNYKIIEGILTYKPEDVLVVELLINLMTILSDGVLEKIVKLKYLIFLIVEVY